MYKPNNKIKIKKILIFNQFSKLIKDIEGIIGKKIITSTSKIKNIILII